MNYNTGRNKIEGQVFCYRPYPEANREKRMMKFSIILRAVLVALIIAAVIIWAAQAEDVTITCWAICKPGDHVNLRIKPDKDSKDVGWLECGDSFQTDGTSRNGWIRVLDAGECACWIYSGYVVTDEPVRIEEGEQNYVCVARERVACRRWVDGPQIRINGRLSWLKNGSDVSVFYIAGDWAVTSRGYIRAEWLEVDLV